MRYMRFAILSLVTAFALNLSAGDSREWMLGRTWANGFTALPDVSTDLDEFQSQYQLNKAQWDAAFGWLATHDLIGLPAGKYPIEGTELSVSIQDSANEPLAKRKSESHREHIDLQYVVKGTERFALLDHESSTPNSEWRRDVIHYDYNPDKTMFIDSTPERFFLFFPNDWHIAKIATDNEDQSIRVVVIKLDYVSKDTPQP